MGTDLHRGGLSECPGTGGSVPAEWGQGPGTDTSSWSLGGNYPAHTLILGFCSPEPSLVPCCVSLLNRHGFYGIW